MLLVDRYSFEKESLTFVDFSLHVDIHTLRQIQHRA